MSPPALQRRSSRGPVLLLALVATIAAAVGSWYLLIYRVDVATVRAQAEADGLEAQDAAARAYLAGRPDDKLSLADIQQAASELGERVPLGRKDISVAQYCQLKAVAAGITDFKYEVVGGMALPDEKPAKQGAPVERLATEPAMLRSQLITTEFSAPYKAWLELERALADAPWLVEVDRLDLRRDVTEGEDVSATVTMRYLYQ